MRKYPYILLAMVFSLLGCSSQKKFETQAPFELGDASCQSWTGGRAEGGSGMLLTIPVSGENMEEMQLRKAYFRERVADLTLEDTEDGWLVKANFLDQTLDKPDIIMHADPKKEVGNRPPRPKAKFPFELGQDQCVISYMEGDTEKFFRIEGVQEKKPLIYR